LCDLLGIRHPVVLAGMAGGPTTPELVAAVSRGGGLGVFGANGMSLDALRQAVGRARQLTDAPVGVNVLLAPPTPATPDAEAVGAALDGLRRSMHLPPPPQPDPPPGAAELVAAGLEAGARVVAIGLGDPAPVAALAREAGAPLVAMVSTVAEARRSVASGADAIVAQGMEAGGHRSTFDLPPDGSVPLVGSFALVPQVAAAVDVPVIATGGVMDGRGLVAALALGAEGVQMGTRFLAAAESGVPPSYRARLASAADTDTVMTRALSGRLARGLRNRLVETMEGVAPASLGFPRQAAASADIRAAAERADDADLLMLWAGQAAGLVGAEALGAEEIVRRVMAEAEAVLRRLGA
jgi:nitronate monooxygenase